MSDFDKEAEREKLRERFAEDDEKRETTERMSELLLQGATMTNSHCDTCGNPLFRYDGQTFCATCQQAADEDSETTAADDTPAATEAAGTATETTNDERQIPVDEPRDEGATELDRAVESRPQETAAPAEPPEPTHDRHAPPSQSSGDTIGSSGDRRSGRDGRSTGSTDDLAAAEASLARTLRRLATAAEGSDDLGRARDHLAAAHEAAEALDAVRNARR